MNSISQVPANTSDYDAVCGLASPVVNTLSLYRSGLITQGSHLCLVKWVLHQWPESPHFSLLHLCTVSPAVRPPSYVFLKFDGFFLVESIILCPPFPGTTFSPCCLGSASCPGDFLLGAHGLPGCSDPLLSRLAQPLGSGGFSLDAGLLHISGSHCWSTSPESALAESPRVPTVWSPLPLAEFQVQDTVLFIPGGFASYLQHLLLLSCCYSHCHPSGAAKDTLSTVSALWDGVGPHVVLHPACLPQSPREALALPLQEARLGACDAIPLCAGLSARAPVRSLCTSRFIFVCVVENNLALSLIAPFS